MHAPVKAGGLLSASEGPVRQRALRLYQRRFKINPPLSPAPATPGLLRAPFEGSPLAPRPQEPTGKVDSHGRTAVSRRTGGAGSLRRPEPWGKGCLSQCFLAHCLEARTRAGRSLRASCRPTPASRPASRQLPHSPVPLSLSCSQACTGSTPLTLFARAYRAP